MGTVGWYEKVKGSWIERRRKGSVGRRGGGWI